MKRFFVSVLIASICTLGFSVTGKDVQILMPKTAYTGDRCELKYVFHSDADLFSDNITGQMTTSMELMTDWPLFAKFSDQCLIQRAYLEHVGFEYTFTLDFIPWHAGIIDFPALDLGGLVRFTLSKLNEKENSAGAVFLIDPDPVTINSIAEKTGVTSLRPSKGPLTAPGTTVILILLAVLFIALCGLAVYVFIRIPVILAWLTGSRELYRIKKLNRHTEKQLKKLKKSKSDDIAFCCQLVAVLRNFLCRRFSEDFTSITTDCIYGKFEELTGGGLSENQAEGVQNLTEIFQRCDYIRFASGSADSRRQPASLYEAVLAPGERELLLTRSLDCLEKFKMEEK